MHKDTGGKKKKNKTRSIHSYTLYQQQLTKAKSTEGVISFFTAILIMEKQLGLKLPQL